MTDQIKDWFLLVVNAIFGLLFTLGVVQDSTTTGMEDSQHAKGYNKPQ
ncbi:hypothetical protein J1P26_18250 [Neobacillus sp. MM2021_6]|nr:MULTISPECIES: phage holin [Bacillaceae]MBO0961651.1 hypothetical protein [Neobacillus sp. MM2021_6]NHC21239.1 hypothetical protein [Bacillus sp. MM2020_4]